MQRANDRDRRRRARRLKSLTYLADNFQRTENFLGARLRIRLACLAEAAPCSGVAKAGGEYRARTGDLLVANQALSQLS
jgi:hypothetical protein